MMCPFKTFRANVLSSLPRYECVTVIILPLISKRETHGGGKYPEEENELSVSILR